MECGSINLVRLFEDLQCWFVFVIFNKHGRSMRGRCSGLDLILEIITNKGMTSMFSLLKIS